jgi:purine-nucleoside phosphorylase
VSWSARAQEAAGFIRRRAPRAPEVAIILGSGLGALADAVRADVAIPYAEIPHFVGAGVEGHAGRLLIGVLAGRPVAVMCGRVHFYEGHAMAQVVLPVRALHALGARTLIVSNAAGGLNRDYAAGDLMLITDHINFMGTNPLVGANEDDLGPRFPDMSQAYDPALLALADGTAARLGIPLRKGIYLGVTGPSYETPAELRMMARWGADAVGMSTVHEVIVARHMGMRVLGLSAIADKATGEVPEKVTHEAVIAAVKRLEPNFVRLVSAIVGQLPG